MSQGFQALDQLTSQPGRLQPLQEVRAQLRREEIDLWPSGLALATQLPVLPLALTAEVSIPVDLEATYTDACQRRRLA